MWKLWSDPPQGARERFTAVIEVLLGSAIRGGHQLAGTCPRGGRGSRGTCDGGNTPGPYSAGGPGAGAGDGRSPARPAGPALCGDSWLSQDQVEGQHAGRLDLVQLGGQADQGTGGRHPRWCFEELQGGEGWSASTWRRASRRGGSSGGRNAIRRAYRCGARAPAAPRQAAQRGEGRQEDTAVAEKLLGPGEQRRHVLHARGLVDQEAAEGARAVGPNERNPRWRRTCS